MKTKNKNLTSFNLFLHFWPLKTSAAITSFSKKLKILIPLFG
jgi:hypothetical protein